MPTWTRWRPWAAPSPNETATPAHNYRVTLYAAAIGRQLGLSPEMMRSLIKGSLLHDVGKIGIPDRILLKPGKLDEEEFRIMKTHVELGGQIVERSAWLADAQDVVLGHHEMVAGTGYPKGKADGDIPLTARIFAIADVFDALTSKRPYKEPWPYEKAVEILEEGRGTHFAPEPLDAFRQVAKPLYDRVGGREDVPRDDLAELMRTYFAQEMQM